MGETRQVRNINIVSRVKPFHFDLQGPQPFSDLYLLQKIVGVGSPLRKIMYEYSAFLPAWQKRIADPIIMVASHVVVAGTQDLC